MSVDDSVLDKLYRPHMERVSYFWSGQHHRIVKGLKKFKIKFRIHLYNQKRLVQLRNKSKVKNHLMGFMFAVESNRLVSTEKCEWA